MSIEQNGCLVFDNYTIIKDSLDCVSMNKKYIINTISPNSYGISCKDQEMDEALKGSDYLILDGVYFGWYPFLHYGQKAKRITGWDCFVYYAKKLNEENGKMFFLGSTNETLMKIKGKMNKEYPNVKVAFYSPPYKSEFSKDDNLIMYKKINEFSPDVLCIGMTAPKQEKWNYQNAKYLNVHVSIAIGNVFDWYAGNTKRPNVFWQKIGMEWLIRIFLRPEIYKRNISNQMRFFRHLLLDILHIRKFPQNTAK